MDNTVYQSYLSILRRELLPALGCTEPIAVALAAARARQLLGTAPEGLEVKCSGNVVKNVMGVTVPNCGGLKGIRAAALIGMVGGNAEAGLEVLAGVTAEDISQVEKLVDTDFCQTALLESAHNLHISVRATGGGHYAQVEIADEHTNIVRCEKDGEVLFQKEMPAPGTAAEDPAYAMLNVRDIIAFANTVKLEDIEPILAQQVAYNEAISQEGLKNRYGANVGSTLLEAYGDEDVSVRARSKAAAGSDARMGGCVLPVIINSGSGNQGMTVSLPVIEYARELGIGDEGLYRALALSNLIAIHQKRHIGRLSAYCGAVSAACGSGAAITYMVNGDGYDAICDTITNTLANVSGMVCDGAKPSCAAKIASAVDAAILGHQMAMRRRGFKSGEGIVKPDVEQTIDAVGRMASEGMQTTDQEILHIMLDQ